ncbi:hypothetical protein C8039_01245 [Halogeometricum sp. wsp3]|nr:hypothetical protein C8039_01245 [Halogeometricum sp. wsp3]
MLAHELAHVRQQTGRRSADVPQVGELEIDPDPRLDVEASPTTVSGETRMRT